MIDYEDTLIPCALLILSFVGYYACRLWEKSLQLEKQKIYIESVLRLVEITLDNLGRSRR